MLAIERRNEILSTIQREQSVIVSELSKKYKVTEETIRRDLEKLEKDGYVKKTYGGAVFVQSLNKDLPFKIREHSNKEEKMIIAKKAAALIEDGDTIMMDSSSTVLEAAKLLKTKKRLTLITNSVELLLELSDYKDIAIISTGGILRESSLSLIGRNAEKTICSYNVDKTLVSCKGVDMAKGVTDSEHEVEVKKAMLGAAKQKILLADYTKFDKVAFTKLTDIQAVDCIITDRAMDEKWSEYLNSLNVKQG